MYLSQLIAADAVNQVLSGRNLTLALPEAQVRFPQATPQQRGGGADLSYGTLRFYGEIEVYLRQLLEKPLTDRRIHTLLLVAIYQLMHDKADAFTVVNQAVHAVNQLKRPVPKAWAKGLVNGVLRNFLRQKARLTVFADTNEVARYSYPQWWINKLKLQYPAHWQQMLVAGNQHPPMTLRVNQKKITMPDYLNLLQDQAIEGVHLGEHAVMLAKPVAVEKIPGFKDGVVSVQDYGAQLAAPLLDVQAEMRVLDACCAPGGKAGHLLELANVHLTGLDSDEVRLARVQSNLTRLQLQANLLVGDAATDEWFDGRLFDRILADVPCTASGIVRRHVDIKWLRREGDVSAFALQQRKILPSLWQKLAKGGKLLYVTCSVFHEENQEQINQFLNNHVDARQLPIESVLSQQYNNMIYMNGQLIPNNLHDGFFYALLQKH
ncbi:MAG: 16S rRNA (cytosine(967)-C(5))-methyltransferase RsmB [Betaproteobacteria bacterium HGW-Betaproteobacteria-22]|nr:MAG: 16S rRNA (cytosine(967)-C(5))-methyltransferase RsmB [Betaproteobacteria bacterium HGW-Betaproteobacteria-22]